MSCFVLSYASLAKFRELSLRQFKLPPNGQQKPSMDNSFTFIATSPTQLSCGVPSCVPGHNTNANIPDPSDPLVVDDDALSLFGGRDIDQDDHPGNRKIDDQINPGPYLSNEFNFACNHSTKPDKFLFGNEIS